MSLLDVYTIVLPRLVVDLTIALLLSYTIAMLLFSKGELTLALVPMLALACIVTFATGHGKLGFVMSFVSACLTAFWYRKHHFGSMFLYWLVLVVLGPAMSIVITLMILSIGSFEYETILNRIWNFVSPVANSAIIWIVIIGLAGITKPRPNSSA